MCHDWPKPSIWPEDLRLIRELLADEEYAELLRRRYCRTAPLLDRRLASKNWKPRTPLGRSGCFLMPPSTQTNSLPWHLVNPSRD